MTETSDKPNSRDPLVEGNRLFGEGRLAEAERAYSDILALRPNAPWAIYRIGEIRLRRGDLSAAREHFTRALSLQPALAEAHAGLGKLAEKAGDREAALGHYRAAQAHAPALKWPGQRIEDLENAAPAGFWPRFKHASELLDARKPADAEPILRALLEAEPDNARVLAKLGRIAGEYGRFEEAFSLYERAIAADAGYPWSHIGMAEMLDAIGDLDGAAAALDAALQRDPSIKVAHDRLRAIDRKRRLPPSNAGVCVQRWPATAGEAAAVTGKPKLAVVTWCLAHNPAGRAMVLAEVAKAHADVEIVGPMFPAYGEDLWEPLRGADRGVPIRGFLAPSFSAFMEGAIRLVTERPCDIAWVSKLRLPGLLIGFLYKLIHGASLIVDIDDDELAFVHADCPLTLDQFLAEQATADWREPYGRRWTQLAVAWAGLGDAVTVCNPVLQERFGGTVIRHSRDAGAFAAARERRNAVRAEFGFGETDKVVLFLGTPRRHKGVLDVARALKAIGDPDAVFCIVGTVRDKELKKDLEAIEGVRLSLHPDQPYARLAELNAMADIVCILQDAADPIARWQTPAKLTDAIATGTTILATPLPPVLDLFEGGKIVPVGEDDLVAALRAALSRSGDEAAARARRAFFEAELSHGANAARAGQVIEEACRTNGKVPGDVMRLLHHIDARMPGSIPRACAAAMKGTLPVGARVAPLRTLEGGVNLVFFWKQNDSGIFGRRQDMLLERFAAMPRVRRILHIDAPMSADRLNSLVPAGAGSPGLGHLVAANTLARFLGTADDEKVARRTFIYRGKDTHLLGRELPPIESYPNAVEAWLRELDMVDNVLAWVCPVARGFADVQRRLGFSFIAADVIDDQRQWPMQPAWRAQIERDYAETFAIADAAFANCRPVADWLAGEGLEPVVVPNGMAAFPDVEAWACPPALAQLPRPVIGYCGNLTQRLDWELIEQLTRLRPDYSFVLIGEPPAEEGYRRAIARPNVHSLGVMAHTLAARHIAAFDAAMIPHLASGLSEHMNPLKLYVYRGLGVPVVSTPVANLDDLKDDILVAATADAFAACLDEAVGRRRRGRSYPDPARMREFGWDSRAQAIWSHLEEVLDSRRQAGTGIAA